MVRMKIMLPLNIIMITMVMMMIVIMMTMVMMMVGCMGAMVKVIRCQEEKINGCVSARTVQRESTDGDCHD